MVSHCGPVPVIDFLASIEPASIPLLAVFAFALSLYPLGLMLGAPCSPCCSKPCDECVEGELPDTVTVTLDGIAELVPGPDLIFLSFTSCFGGGAEARVTEPFGDFDEDAGPIAAMEVVSGGAGYAVFGRVEPELTIAGSGSGATFTPTYTSSNDACGLPYYSITSVAVSGDGTGYTDGETLFVTLGDDDTEMAGAVMTLRTVRVEPTITATVSGNGSGADITPTLTQDEDENGRDYWKITGFTIADGGSGYAQSDEVQISVDDGEAQGATFFAVVDTVDGNGAITAISVLEQGYFFKDSGEPESVVIDSGGEYWRDDPTAEPHVAEITVAITGQNPPSNGTGAEIEAIVDDDPDSPTFGEVTGFTITQGGDDYLGYELVPSCLSRFDGRSIVLQRTKGSPCLYQFDCNSNNGDDCSPDFDPERERLQMEYYGPGQPLQLRLYHRAAGDFFFGSVLESNATMESDENVTDCSEMSLAFSPTAGLPEGASATVEAGGDYAETDTCRRVLRSDLETLTAEIQWDGLTWEIGFDGLIESPDEETVGGVFLESELCGSAYSFRAEVLAGTGPLTRSIFFNIGVARGIVTTAEGSVYSGSPCEIRWHAGTVECVKTYFLSPTAIATCQYEYQIVPDIPVDEDEYPSGSASLAESSSLQDFPPGYPGDPPFPGAFGDCEIAPPTITFSRLP